MISHKSIRIHLSPGSQPQKCVIVTPAGIFAVNVVLQHNDRKMSSTSHEYLASLLLANNVQHSPSNAGHTYTMVNVHAQRGLR